VLAAVNRDLKAIAELDEQLAMSARAETARSLARTLDDPATAATARMGCARELGKCMDRLWELAPKATGGDPVDELHVKRTARLRRAGAQDP